MLPERLSEADLEALLSPPAHAVLSHLPTNPLRALADRLAAGVEAGAAAEGPMAELGGPEVCEMELALQRAVNAYYQAEPSPSNAGQFIAQQIRPIEFPTGTPKDTQEAIRAETARVRQLPDGAVCYVEGKNGGLGVKRRHVQQGEQPGRPPGRPPEG